MERAPGTTSRRLRRYLTVVLILAAWSCLAFWADRLYAAYRANRLHAQATTVAAAEAGALANAVNQRLALVQGLAAFVTASLDDPKALDAQFPLFAQALYGMAGGVRNLAVAPGFVVRKVFPTDPGNLKVIGNDILADKRPGFSDAVKRAIATREITVHEPVPLIQGGLGVIARKAIFKGDTPWGAVGAVFSVDPLLADVGAGLDGYDWAVRSAAGTQVGGSASVFDHNPAIATVSLPEGYWEIGVVPIGGWEAAVAAGAEPMAVRVGMAAFGMILAVTTWTLSRRRGDLEQLVAERTRELSQANQELGHFAHAAAHDLQEPLRGIASYSQLILRNYDWSLDARGHLWLEEVVGGARQMKVLLDDVQLYLAEQDIPLPQAPVQAQRCLESALRKLSDAVKTTGARVEAENLPLVMADHHRLTEIFAVLLSNAIEYRSPFRKPLIRISAREAEGMMAIDVADNGIGIDPAYHERIFGVFQRLHARGEHPGTGMGLAIAVKMTRRLGGRMCVSSTPDQGSVFTVFLPAG